MNLSDDVAKAGKIPEAITEVVASRNIDVQVKMSSVPHKSSQAYPFRDMTDTCIAFRRLRPAPLLLGHRPHRRHRSFPELHLPAAHHPFHRGTAVPVGAGQGLGDGSRHHAAVGLGVKSRTPPRGSTASKGYHRPQGRGIECCAPIEVRGYWIARLRGR